MLFSEDFYSQLYFANGSCSLNESPNESSNESLPDFVADIKSTPTDFRVEEWLEVDCSGEGEHIWLNITKVTMQSDQVAKALAQIAGVPFKDVGISGMKDFLATTSQWFSVWLPGIMDADLPDWYSLESESFKINQVVRHSRKLKRGTHLGNHFKIVLRNVKGDIASFQQRLELLETYGVPNYFGEQRFGRGGSNLKQAYDSMLSGRKIKQRQKRSMVLSSARSWLFNCVLSARLKEKSWLIVQQGEPLNLAGSRQFFTCENVEESQQRLAMKDVHTTAPLWGKGEQKVLEESLALRQFEQTAMGDYEVFQQGLIKAGMEYSRRALRYFPQDLSWSEQGSNIDLSFTLGRGQFATSLLRELVIAR